MRTTVATFHNLLEPEGLIRHFQENPPQDFEVLDLEWGLPAFSTRFDLFTTIDPAIRRRLDRVPLLPRSRSLLRANSCFIGTTVSEYVLFPGAAASGDLVRAITALTPRYPLVIVKDLPTEAILVGDQALAVSRAVSDACRSAGFVLVDGQALAYVPIDFLSIEEFLAGRSEARRKNIRRKLRSRAALQVDAIPTGDAKFRDSGFLETMYALYLNVYQQSEVHFDLLTPSFFRAVLQDGTIEGIVFTYRSGGQLIGYNICVCQNDRLIDKYVGFAYPAAREHNLYAVSWFRNLEYALERGFRQYVAGWTDPEVKRTLGARFTFTQHAVSVRNPLVRTLMKPFKRFFESDREWRAGHVTRTDP